MGERTEAPTDKRRRDERKKGNVFMSREVITLAGLLAVLYTIQILGNIIMSALAGGIETFWTLAGTAQSFTFDDAKTTFVHSLSVYALAALPALLVAGLVAVVLTLAQTRGNVSGEAMSPKFSRLSPKQGIKRVFSMRGLIELLKSLLKIIILAYVIYNSFIERFGELPRLMEMDFLTILSYGGAFLMDVVTSVAVIYAFLAAADYLFQRWQYEKDLRMSKQEIKEEYKQLEGDPQIKGKIRERQRQMANSRMMQNVPEADVVIRNPTHYAVAVKYDPEESAAPIVLAKGADLMALRIIRVAEENDVMLVENRPLARSLYDNVPLDREIPEEFYGAVAEVLAFVYSVKKKTVPGMAPAPN